MGFEDWTTTELFEYLMDNYIIPYDSKFDDWMHSRSDMLMLARDFYDNYVDLEDNDE